MQDLSRRGFLSGTAGAALGMMLPLRPGAQAATSLVAASAVQPLAGATVSPAAYGVSNALTAAKIADGYFGMPLATTIQKIFLMGGFGTEPPPRIAQLAPAGCQFLVCVKPSRQLSPHVRSRLAAWLAMMNKAGINYRVALWAECNDHATFPTAQDWLAYWRYYAPVVKAAGVACCYEPGCGLAAVGRAVQYFPSSPPPDELWLDYYGSAFKDGSRIGKVINAGRAAGLSIGVGEWAWTAHTAGFSMTMPIWNDYCSYLIYQAQSGNLKLGSIYFSGVHNTTENVIRDSGDPRIPMIQKVARAVQPVS